MHHSASVTDVKMFELFVTKFLKQKVQLPVQCLKTLGEKTSLFQDFLLYFFLFFGISNVYAIYRPHLQRDVYFAKRWNFISVVTFV